MRIAGLDLSLTATGYCSPEGRTATLSSKQRGMDRIEDLQEQLEHLLSDDVPALVAIEDYAFSRGGHAHETGELGGVIKFMLRRQGVVPYVLIGPSSLKKFATGKGNANKIAMAVGAAKLSREFADDNQCDAWWLREMALYRYEGAEFTVQHTAYRDEAVSKVGWPVLEGRT